MSKWERGESIPDIEQLEKLSELYSLTINEIITGEKKVHKIEAISDKERQKNIFAVTGSILVFFAYFFNYLTSSVDVMPGVEVVFRGYELIFNGTGGEIVIHLWLVFLIIVSHLILNLFVMTNVIAKEKVLQLYFLLSSIFVISSSLLMVVLVPNYTLFPQIVIIMEMIFIIILNSKKTKEKSQKSSSASSVFEEMKQFRKDKKNGTVDKGKYLDENQLSNKVFIVSVILFFVSLFYFYYSCYWNDHCRDCWGRI